MSNVDRVFSALSDPTRREVMERISKAGDMSPTEVAGELPVTRQAVTKHLDVLMQAGLVTQVKRGRETRYSLTPEPINEALTWMTEVGAAWDARLERLRALLET
jgi:DNA-binding transcriptional ArsR family regulator